MVSNRFGKGFGKNKKDKNTKKNKCINDGLFLFSINYETGETNIKFAKTTGNLQKDIDELEANNFTMLVANPGCSLLLDELLKRVNVLVEKNINQYNDPDLIPEIYLQAFERVSRKMISDEIYFPVPELRNLRLKHESVGVDRHPENNLISNL